MSKRDATRSAGRARYDNTEACLVLIQVQTAFSCVLLEDRIVQRGDYHTLAITNVL